MASQPGQGKDLYEELMALKWYWRTPLGLISATIVAAVAAWLSEQIRYPWIGYVCGACCVLYCLTLAWETVAAVLLCGGIWYLFRHANDSEKVGLFLLAYIIWLNARIDGVDKKQKELEWRITQLQDNRFR